MTGLIRALVAVTLFTGIASAQAEAPIRIVHGSNAGAPQDVMLRILADELQKALSESVIVEPRPGAEGQIAMHALKQAPADGRTILSDGTGITSILQIPGARHKWTDFEPLYRLQLDDRMIATVRAGDPPSRRCSPFRSRLRRDAWPTGT